MTLIRTKNYWIQKIIPDGIRSKNHTKQWYDRNILFERTFRSWSFFSIAIQKCFTKHKFTQKKVFSGVSSIFSSFPTNRNYCRKRNHYRFVAMRKSLVSLDRRFRLFPSINQATTDRYWYKTSYYLIRPEIQMIEYRLWLVGKYDTEKTTRSKQVKRLGCLLLGFGHNPRKKKKIAISNILIGILSHRKKITNSLKRF